MRGGIPIQGTAAGTGPQVPVVGKKGVGKRGGFQELKVARRVSGTSHSGDEGEERGMVVKLRFSQW